MRVGTDTVAGIERAGFCPPLADVPEQRLLSSPQRNREQTRPPSRVALLESNSEPHQRTCVSDDRYEVENLDGVATANGPVLPATQVAQPYLDRAGAVKS